MNWFFSSFTALVLVVITAIVFYGCIILFTRLSGLRSFSKMSAFDFATTVAFGSLRWPPPSSPPIRRCCGPLWRWACCLACSTWWPCCASAPTS